VAYQLSPRQFTTKSGEGCNRYNFTQKTGLTLNPKQKLWENLNFTSARKENDECHDGSDADGNEFGTHAFFIF
jgi:hypothetical protein